MRYLLILFIIYFISCASQNETSSQYSGKKENTGVPEPQISFNPEQYVCYKTDLPLKIDGRMNEPVWQNAEWTNDFVDIEGTQ